MDALVIEENINNKHKWMFWSKANDKIRIYSYHTVIDWDCHQFLSQSHYHYSSSDRNPRNLLIINRDGSHLFWYLLIDWPVWVSFAVFTKDSLLFLSLWRWTFDRNHFTLKNLELNTNIVLMAEFCRCQFIQVILSFVHVIYRSFDIQIFHSSKISVYCAWSLKKLTK